MVQILLEARAAVEDQDDRGFTPLLVAAYTGHGAVVKTLLGRRGAIECEDHEGSTPLRRAALDGREEVVQILLEAGANTKC